MPREYERPLAVDMPTLSAVNEPGPRETATPPKSFLSIPRSESILSIAGTSLSE